SRRSIYVGLAWAGFVFLSHMIGSALVGIHGDTERRRIVEEGMSRWLQDHPPPPGVQMHQGRYPMMSRPQMRPGAQQTEAERAQQEWFQEWSAVSNELYAAAEAARLAQASTDWRPVLSYANNLDRLGDWLLDTDAAWVLL